MIISGDWRYWLVSSKQKPAGTSCRFLFFESYLVLFVAFPPTVLPVEDTFLCMSFPLSGAKLRFCRCISVLQFWLQALLVSDFRDLHACQTVQLLKLLSMQCVFQCSGGLQNGSLDCRYIGKRIKQSVVVDKSGVPCQSHFNPCLI